MRCDDVMRELSAPTDGLDRAALDEHVNACPRCASWAAQVDRLDRIWEETRPEEPSALAFDAMWQEVTRAVAEPEVLPFPAWRRRGLVRIVMAYAAVLVIAAVYAVSRPTPAVASMHEFQVEEGTTLVVRLGAGPDAVTKVDVTPQSGGSETDMVSADLDVLNYMESLN